MIDAPPAIVSKPSLGVEAARCRENEPGPAVIVMPEGLKDRRGRLRVELYPPGENEFLQDDNILVAAGKTFRRVDIEMPATGPVRICVRVPGPGTYTLSVLHDRNADHRFNVSSDGIGFSGNPKLGLARPQASEARFSAGPALTSLAIVMNYRNGLLSFGPLRHPKP